MQHEESQKHYAKWQSLIQRLHTVWFYLYEILEKAKSEGQTSYQRWQRMGEGNMWELTAKEHQGHFGMMKYSITWLLLHNRIYLSQLIELYT